MGVRVTDVRSVVFLVLLWIVPACALYSVPYRESETVSQEYDYDRLTTYLALQSYLRFNGYEILDANPILGLIRSRYSFPGTSTSGTAKERMEKYVESPRPLAINPYGKNPFVTLTIQVDENAMSKSRVLVRAHFQTWSEPFGIGGVGPHSMSSKNVWEQEMLSALAPHVERMSKQNTPSSVPSSAATGTGFLVGKGYLLTAQHVVASRSRITAHVDGHRYPASVVIEDAANDIALLKIDGDVSTIQQTGLPLGDSSAAKQGEKVWTLGYPLSVYLGEKPVLNEGSISSLYGLRGDPRFFQMSVPIQPGNSGGPVMNERGEVLGLALSSLDDIASLKATGAIPQNVNFGIKINYAYSLLASIPNFTRSRTPRPLGTRFMDIIEQVRPNIVLIQASQ